ncbi:MAG: phenylalanine--tRNA ligase subunit beta [Acidimicrobiales bacterium]|nr:phenylalanine--tRNA ligase subunit beta [Acidimicrobiales bacterium]
MRVLLSWLRELAPLDGDPAELAETMSDLGMTVESLERVGEGLGGIVVARVLSLRPHPQADRIQLVEVDRGDGEALQICCGAFNMRVGDLVPLATLGTVMPGGLEIGRRKLRGEWSNGMLCSAAELQLGSDAAGILVLDGALEVGAPLAEALGITADVVFDLEINPNRPDAMSVAGVARDLAARSGVPFTLPEPVLVEAGDTATSALASVEIVDPDLCGRFVARVLEGVSVGPSPRWLADRLTLAGMRPINNVVDVSNYVMLELGQPNHPYDLARVPGRGLRVRRARPGETMVTLDDVERRFVGDDLLICDARDAPVGIAGIMGGASSEIAPDTGSVLVEMAWFEPMAVARTSKRLGLRTEASARFERGCDPWVIDLAMARFCQLLGATAAPDPIDERGVLPERGHVTVRMARVNALLGAELAEEQVAGYLDPIGFTTERVAEGVLSVALPSWRLDSSTETDAIEEIARHHGYARIAARVPRSTQAGSLTPFQRARRLVRDVLTGLGLSEAMPLPFLAPGDLERAGLDPAGVRLANPLAAEESVLRTSLLPGLLRAVAHNANHRQPGARLFEIGHVFGAPRPGEELPDERERVGAVLAGADAAEAKRAWDVLAAALRVDGVEVRAATPPGLHPTRSAELVAGGAPIGEVGEIDPDVLAAHGIVERVGWLGLDLGALFALARGERPYRPVSRFPSSDVDLAFVVPDTEPAADVEATLRAAAGELLSALRLFDVYRGAGVAEGARSLAFSLRLQALDCTLTDAEVGEVRARCIGAVETAHRATLRG